jgi:hypothetical protein
MTWPPKRAAFQERTKNLLLDQIAWLAIQFPIVKSSLYLTKKLTMWSSASRVQKRKRKKKRRKRKKRKEKNIKYRYIR